MAKPNTAELEAELEALRRENTELRKAKREGALEAQAHIERLTQRLVRAEAVTELRPVEEPAAPQPPRAKYVLRCRGADGQTITLRPGDLIPEGADLAGIDPSALEGG